MGAKRPPPLITPPPAPAPAPDPRLGPPYEVRVYPDEFIRSTLTIPKGATVSFEFYYNVVHNVTFEGADGPAPDHSNRYIKVRFDTASTFRYRCTHHSSDFSHGQVGKIVVQ